MPILWLFVGYPDTPTPRSSSDGVSSIKKNTSKIFILSLLFFFTRAAPAVTTTFNKRPSTRTASHIVRNWGDNQLCSNRFKSIQIVSNQLSPITSLYIYTLHYPSRMPSVCPEIFVYLQFKVAKGITFRGGISTSTILSTSFVHLKYNLDG
ncbi:hypothetical protein CLIB1423_02S08658 [[Candida] railenensis]|uniref:Uncharacterized protein n=1 Tax=[Candida] railenensis TaxID=45579 RepID=A0A9P0VX06_9ASCO|nr:hypothetical protein CLIB1423_02S08658 [[Candida] railenensis]